MTELKKIGLDGKLGTFLVPQDNTECFAVQSPKKRTLTFEMISGSDEYKTDYTRYIFTSMDDIVCYIKFNQIY